MFKSLIFKIFSIFFNLLFFNSKIELFIAKTLLFDFFEKNTNYPKIPIVIVAVFLIDWICHPSTSGNLIYRIPVTLSTMHKRKPLSFVNSMQYSITIFELSWECGVTRAIRFCHLFNKFAGKNAGDMPVTE